MPPAKKSYKPRRQRKMRPKKGVSNVAEWASLSQSQTLLPPGGSTSGIFVPNTMYDVLNVNLSSFDRASAVAKAYQFYRIKNVRMTFRSPLDTFAGELNTGPKPQFYYMIDKSASIPNTATLDTLKSMGARPKMIDEKNLVVNWKPSILVLAESVGGNTPSEYKISPWLSTEANTINHLGIYFYSDVGLSQYGSLFFVDIEVQFEFKKPVWIVPAPTDGSPQPLSQSAVIGRPKLQEVST